MYSRSAIILAGGGSQRFQGPREIVRDKAMELFKGKTLLENVVVRASSFVDEIVITVNSQQRKSKYERLLRNKVGKGIWIRIDEDGCSGPLNGIRTGLRYVSSEHCMVLPTDTPLIESRLLLKMFPYLERFEWVVPTWPNGLLEVLMSAFRKGYALSSADLLCSMKRRGPYDLIRGAPRVRFVSIVEELQSTDPNLLTFVNINYPRDLQDLPVKTLTEGHVQKSISLSPSKITIQDINEIANELNAITEKCTSKDEHIDLLYDRLTEMRSHFWLGVIKEAEGNSIIGLVGDERSSRDALEEAANHFKWEASMFIEKGIGFLSAHALMDAYKCLSKIRRSSEAAELRKKAEDIYNEMSLDVRRKSAE